MMNSQALNAAARCADATADPDDGVSRRSSPTRCTTCAACTGQRRAALRILSSMLRSVMPG
jgi:hypothetical protein